MYKTNEGCFDMKNRTKKVLSLAIIGMMLLTGAAGCSTGADANNEESNAYHDPTYNPFGKYEETVKIKEIARKEQIKSKNYVTQC